MKISLVIFSLAAFWGAAIAVEESETLDGWADYHLTLNNEGDATAVRKFVTKYDYLLAKEDHLGMPEDVIVRPESAKDFESMLRKRRIQYEVADKDIGSSIRKERVENEIAEVLASFNVGAFDASTYFAQSSQVHAWLDSLARDNSIASVESIGRSHEGRDLRVIKLSSGGTNKPVVFLDSAIHAREWLAPATLNYIIKALITDYNSGNAQARNLLTKYDWIFLPVVNPDGYDYTFRASSTRFWRKTRKPYGFYYGADPNRNFDDNFGGPSTSNNPASDIYHGPHPFSEPETKALSEFLTRYKSRIAIYISFHTYGQLWLTPPGFTRVLPNDHTEMMRVANAGANALKNINGNTWRVGQPANIGLYEAAGGSYDWVKNKLGVKYSYTLELRPRWPAGINGFLADVKDIPPSGREVFAGIKATIEALP